MFGGKSLLSHIIAWVSNGWSNHKPIEDNKIDLTKLEGDNLSNDVYYVSEVTQIAGCNAILGDKYCFSISNASSDVWIGSVVTCTLNANIVSEVCVIEKWDEQAKEAEIENYGIIKNIKEDILIVSPGPVSFNIKEVVCEFLPLIGDMVQMTVEKYLDGLEVKSKITHVFPVALKTKHGIVTTVESDWGYINENVLFFFEDCLPGYLPVCGDRVVFSVFRCCTGESSYRTFQVTPLDNVSTLPMDSILMEILFTPQNVIRAFVNKPQIIETSLCNISSEAEEISQLIVHSKQSVSVELNDPKDVNVVLKPGESRCFSFEVSAKYIGFTVITFEYIFKYKILRFELKILVVPETFSNNNNNKQGIEALGDSVLAQYLQGEQEIPKRRLRPNFQGIAYPGRRSFRPCKFIPVKLGFYKIPDQLISLFESHTGSCELNPGIDNLKTMFPCLKAGLKPNNYQTFFHSLLYIEEIEMLKRISKLSFTSSLSTEGDYMVLFVDEDSYFNFLNVGDRVYAKKLWKDNEIYEGFIWMVRSSEFLIKFSVDFHTSHVENSLYSFSFEISRNSYRLFHQSVDDCTEYFGITWLFAKQIPMSVPYIIPVDNESLENHLHLDPSTASLETWNRCGSGYGSRQVKYTFQNELLKEVKRYIRWINPDLNSEQRAAVIHILEGVCRPFPYLIFGPPGTGKSVTLVETVLQIYNLIIGSRIVVAAPSNSAVDLLCVALLSSGFVKGGDLIRLCSNNYSKSSKQTRGILKHAGVPTYDSKNTSSEGIPRVSREFIAKKRLVITTVGCLGTLRHMGFPRGYFSHIVVDEASQLTEPMNLLVTFLMSNTGHLTLAGDPNQLGPIVHSWFGKVFGLSTSFQKRIMMSSGPYMVNKSKFPDSFGYNPMLVTKLVKSYRSLPALLMLPNLLFYSGDLQPMVAPTDSNEAKLYELLKPILPEASTIPMVFHSVHGIEDREPDSFSFFNSAEAFQVAAYLAQLYSKGIDSFDIGIITPYTAQVKKITKILEDFKLEVPIVGSVDEFQGQEKQVIILSTVRSKVSGDSDSPKPSFVFQPDRVNVAITRAKVLLIIIGNICSLHGDDNWKSIIKYAVENKSYVGAKS